MSSGDVTVLAGGWSVKNLPLDRLCGEVIGVNDAAIKAPHVHRIVSMDRLWAEYRWPMLCARRQATWLRRSAVQNLHIDWDNDWLTVFDNDNASSKLAPMAHEGEPWILNGSNSGFCALNLAFQMRPRRIFLLGFDMNRDRFGKAYWHDPYPWNPSTRDGSTTNGTYAKWALEFKAAARAFSDAGIEVFNVSPQSAIQDFQKITPSQYIRECKQ